MDRCWRRRGEAEGDEGTLRAREEKLCEGDRRPREEKGVEVRKWWFVTGLLLVDWIANLSKGRRRELSSTSSGPFPSPQRPASPLETPRASSFSFRITLAMSTPRLGWLKSSAGGSSKRSNSGTPRASTSSVQHLSSAASTSTAAYKDDKNRVAAYEVRSHPSLCPLEENQVSGSLVGGSQEGRQSGRRLVSSSQGEVELFSRLHRLCCRAPSRAVGCSRRILSERLWLNVQSSPERKDALV